MEKEVDGGRALEVTIVCPCPLTGSTPVKRFGSYDQPARINFQPSLERVYRFVRFKQISLR